MKDDNAPLVNSSHILYPHHIGILTLILLAVAPPKIVEHKHPPPQFLLHVYRLLLFEVSEVAQPRSFKQIIQDLNAMPDSSTPAAADFIHSANAVVANINSPDQIAAFFANIAALYTEREEEDFPVFQRRSLFGYFCRRCYISFLKLSFSGLSKLQKDYQSWATGTSDAGHDVVRRDLLTSADLFMSKAQVDKSEWARPHFFQEFDRASAAGDHKSAVENARHFFAQQFDSGPDSSLRQHTLLNLVRMHYVNAEFESARKLLGEAISVARTQGDQILLQHCMSMLHRMPSSPEMIRLPINDIQPDLHPLEILNDVKKLLEDENEQPISASFKRLVEAAGVFDLWTDNKPYNVVPADDWAQHSIQAVAWTGAGCRELGAIEEDIVIAFTDIGTEDNNRLTCIVNKSYYLARNGEYGRALAILLYPLTWRGLIISDYHTWAGAVWHVLFMRAARRGQSRLCREQLIPRRGPGPWSMSTYFMEPGAPPPKISRKILDPILEVLQLRVASPGAPAALEPLLSVLWNTEFLGRFDVYRTAVIMLADMCLEFGLPKYSLRLMKDIVPQVINGANVEQRALACFVLARCLIADEHPNGEEKATNLRSASEYLLKAEADYTKLLMFQQAQVTVYILAIVYHNLGQEVDRDSASKRHAELEKVRREQEEVSYDTEIQEILDLVTEVGGAIASRRSQ